MTQAHTPYSANDNDGTWQTNGDQTAPVTGAAKEVAQSVKEHARDVGGEVVDRGRNLAGQVGQRLSGEARTQNDRLASGLRKLADDLDEMSDGTSSVARTMVQQASETSRQAATYLQRQGPEGLVRDVQQFARRRPGVFLAGAAVAGFVAGRVGKGLLSKPSNPSPGTSPATGAPTPPAVTSTVTPPMTDTATPVLADHAVATPASVASRSGTRP